jgi:Family of unknown function (DUF6325)
VDFYESGPVDILMLRLPGDRFSRELALALRALALAGEVRVVDLLFVCRSTDGLVGWTELDDLRREVHPVLADLAGHLEGGLLDREDVDEAAHGLPRGESVTVVVIENRWAVPLLDVVHDGGGYLAELARLPAATASIGTSSGDDTVGAS